MLVLVAVGIMSVPWMIDVSGLLAVERHWRRGDGVVRLAGSAAVILGVAVMLHPQVLTSIAAVHHHAGM